MLRFPAKGDPHRRPWVYWLGWKLFRLSFRGYFGWRVAGWEHVPSEGAFILAANHASYMDPGLVGGACGRPVSYFGRESLFRIAAVGWLYRSVGALPLDRDGASGKGLRTILNRLAEGEGVVLFPEGTRTRDGALQAPRAGVGLLALKSGAPVVPVRVFGTFEAFGRHRRFPRPVPVAVRFGPPLDLTAARAEAAVADRTRVKELYLEVAEGIMRAIGGLERP